MDLLSLLDKVMPQDTRWVFQYPHESCDLHLIIIYCWLRFSARCVRCIQFSEVNESCESPIALFSYESVMSIYLISMGVAVLAEAKGYMD